MDKDLNRRLEGLGCKEMKKVLFPQDIEHAFLRELDRIEKSIEFTKKYKKDHPKATTNEAIIKFSLNEDNNLNDEERSKKLFEQVKLSRFFHKNFTRLSALKVDNLGKSPLESIYRNIDLSKEFGITRFIADQMQHLPKLLKTSEIAQSGDQRFELIAEKKLEGKKVQFKHTITATTLKEATEISKGIKENLIGIQNKIWLACWKYASEISKTQFTVSIADLMKACYPGKTNFSAKDRDKFYKELEFLKLARFILIWEDDKEKQNKKQVFKYEIPFLSCKGSVSEKSNDGKEIIQKVYIDLCGTIGPSPKKEKLFHVGTPIKNSTLALRAGDTYLAQYIQTRVNQLQGGRSDQPEGCAKFRITTLIEAAGLCNTYDYKPRTGRARLRSKLIKLIEAKIIRGFKLKRMPDKDYFVLIF